MENVIRVDFSGNRARALVNLANQLARRGNHALALKLYRRACKTAPNLWELHYNLGYCLLQSGRLSEAIRSFDRALALGPREPVVRFNLARALAQRGDRIAAARQWRRCLELDPTGRWASVTRKCLARIE